MPFLKQTSQMHKEKKIPNIFVNGVRAINYLI